MYVCVCLFVIFDMQSGEEAAIFRLFLRFLQRVACSWRRRGAAHLSALICDSFEIRLIIRKFVAAVFLLTPSGFTPHTRELYNYCI